MLVVTYTLNGLLMIALPVAIALWLTRHYALPWRWFWLGGATFVASQIVHIPLNALIGQGFAAGWLPYPPEAWRLVVFSGIGGLTAGLCEEVARYVTLRWWARDVRSWRGAIFLGVGHGGTEAIILGILVLVNLIAMLAYRGVDLSTLLPAEQLVLAQEQIAAYWSAPWPLTVLGAVERALTLPVQVGFSVLVAQAFLRQGSRSRGLGWLVLAILWHAAIDAVVGYLGSRLLPRGLEGALIVEGVLALVTAASLGLIYGLRTSDGGQPPPNPDHDVTVQPVAIPAILLETPENLERTRYDH